MFDFLKNISNKGEDSWGEAVATFTGKVEKEFVYILYGTKKEYYNKYEIVYSVGEEECHSWYSFHPDPDPGVEALSGTTMKIRYMKNKPQIFELAENS
ncbi:MAG: hypothetical protein K6B68_14400 [Eubacterium sp.]|nr:hypothetical protein [Eubacterium sp.]